MHHHQCTDHGDERDAVQEERPPGPDGGEQQPGQRRTDGSRGIELGRVEGDGRREIGLRNQRRHEGLPTRDHDSAEHPGERGDHQDHPGLVEVECPRTPEHERRAGHEDLGGDEHQATISTIGERPAERSEEERRDELGESGESDVDRLLCELEEHERDGEVLQPAAGVRCHGADEKHPEVAMAKGSHAVLEATGVSHCRAGTTWPAEVAL